MGQRANLVLAENGQKSVFYTHWRANTLPNDLFWGPTYAAAFIRSQRPNEDREILDEVWGEGGAIADYDANRLTFFGGEDVLYDVPLRRMHLSLMKRVWKGWELCWAHEGVVEIADYLEIPRDKVLTHMRGEIATSLAPPPELDWVEQVGSIRTERGVLRFYPLSGSPMDYLSVGAQLLDTAAEFGFDHAVFREWTQEFPRGGFHIDHADRTVDFWTAHDAPAAAERVAAKWDGWNVTWHRDRFEFQLERTEGLLQFVIEDDDRLLDRLRESLLREPNNRSGPDLIVDVAKHFLNQGEEVTYVNPNALRDAQMILSLDARRGIFEQAVGKRRHS